MTYEEYLAEVESVQRQHPEWRTGQTHFNVLYRHRPDLSECIRMTAYDPFYNNDVVPSFLRWAKSQW